MPVSRTSMTKGPPFLPPVELAHVILPSFLLNNKFPSSCMHIDPFAFVVDPVALDHTTA